MKIHSEVIQSTLINHPFWGEPPMSGTPSPRSLEDLEDSEGNVSGVTAEMADDDDDKAEDAAPAPAPAEELPAIPTFFGYVHI